MIKKRNRLHPRAVGIFFSDPWAVAATIVLLLLVSACVLLPFFLKYNYRQADYTITLQGPTAEHLLGTDSLGRDMLARLVYGGRITLGITALATMIAAVVGGALGLLSGYLGGRVDFFVMRIIDGLSSIPSLLLAIVMECALGWGKGNSLYGLAIAAIAPFAKLIRAAVLEISDSEYIGASRALGATGFQVVRRHIIPNVMPVFVIQIVTCFADTLILCTILGYLQIGFNPPTPEWGALFHRGKELIRTVPRLTVLPVAAIILTTVSLNIIGNSIRDSLSTTGGERR